MLAKVTEDTIIPIFDIIRFFHKKAQKAVAPLFVQQLYIYKDYDKYYGSNTASHAYEVLSKVFVRPYFFAKYNPCILLPIIEGS